MDNKKMEYPEAIKKKYPGGKGGTYQSFINLMPPHEVYIESHLGGGAIMRYKRNAKRNIGIEINPEIIEIWKNLDQPDIELVHGDAISYLKSYNYTGKELIYCDPPYLRQTRKKARPIYKYEYTREHHIELLEVVKTIPTKVMISGYDSKLYAESLKDWQTHSFQSNTHGGTATEWIWMNYPSPVELHDYRYLGNNFRERDRIKNRSKRWLSRLKSLPVLERKALFSAMESIKDKD